MRKITITKKDIAKFGISKKLLRSNRTLVDLILRCESMRGDDERKYWFDIFPEMRPEHVKKLQSILQNEKDQLAELDAMLTNFNF
jgi:hypothetical protein